MCPMSVSVFRFVFAKIGPFYIELGLFLKLVYNGVVPMKDDTSVMTYRGHRVKKSLIRAKFSPAETTGQRYIYTGCGTGRLISEC